MVFLLYSLVFFIIGWIISSQRIPRKSYIVTYFIGIVLFWGLSYIDAPDTPGYINKFNYEIEPLSGHLDTQFELGYSWLASLMKTIYPHYWLFQFVVLGIEVILIFKGLRFFYDEKNLLAIIPLLFFLYPTNLAAFRQGIATSIFIYSLHYLNEENTEKSLLYPVFIFVSAIFHQSAIMLILLYFYRFAKKYLSINGVVFLFLLFSDVIWILNISILSQFNFLQAFFSNDSMDMGWKYNELMNGATLTGTYGLAKVIEINVVVILYTLFCKEYKETELFRLNMLLYVFSGLCIGGLVGHRLNYYWSILYYVCLIRGVISVFSQKKQKSTGYIVTAIYMFWFFIIKCEYVNENYLLLFSY